jgi:hypothetical protein
VRRQEKAEGVRGGEICRGAGTEGGAARPQERDGWNEMKIEKGSDSPRNARASGV